MYVVQVSPRAHAPKSNMHNLHSNLCMLCRLEKESGLSQARYTSYTVAMASAWLLSIDHNGLTVTAEFMQKLRNGDKAALRALAKTDLTALYRRGYTKLTPEQHQVSSFFPTELPPTALIPFVRGGPRPPSAWVKDWLVMEDDAVSAKARKKRTALLKYYEKSRSADQGLWVKWTNNGKKVTAIMMKPNPKFELVVVNKHDRAALLRLLGEVDTASNVLRWLGERTEQTGATRSMVLYADYVEWCDRAGETAAGKKSFAQALVAEGVVKLPRSGAGERYELTLRRAAAR